MPRRDWIDLIRSISPEYGVDPQAALAVSSSEGLSGAVGDQGTSFGPFQLHVGGALPAGRGRAWAESPEGIRYAIQQMAKVARGKRGAAAVRAIVSGFERPADPEGEIGRATNALSMFRPGSYAAAQGKDANPGPTTQAPVGDPAAVTRGLIQDAFSRNKKEGIGDVLLRASKQAATRRMTPDAPMSPQRGASRPIDGKPVTGALAEAFYDPLGQYDNGRFSSKGIGGHSDHVHLSITKAQAMIQAIRQAQTMGLAARENPYVDPVDPVHVKGSYHYRDFPGLYGGKRLGEAVDVSGNPAQMAAYYRWATTHLR